MIEEDGANCFEMPSCHSPQSFRCMIHTTNVYAPQMKRLDCPFPKRLGRLDPNRCLTFSRSEQPFLLDYSGLTPKTPPLCSKIDQAFLHNRLLRLLWRMLWDGREGILGIAGICSVRRSLGLPDRQQLRLLSGGMLPVRLLRLGWCLVCLLRLRRLSRDRCGRLRERRLVGMHRLSKAGVLGHGRVGLSARRLLRLLLRL
jgi:hypothetical protein